MVGITANETLWAALHRTSEPPPVNRIFLGFSVATPNRHDCPIFLVQVDLWMRNPCQLGIRESPTPFALVPDMRDSQHAGVLASMLRPCQV